MTTIPLQSVVLRADAVPNREMLAVRDDSAIKTNGKDDPTNEGSGLDLETMLNVRAWVRDLGDRKHCWVDLHVFDDDDQLIRSETLPLQYVREAEGGAEYGFDGSVYRGTGASPGSVWLAPDARKVQYRIYYEAAGSVYSDGLLRQHDVAPDSAVTNPPAAVRPVLAGRRRSAS